MHWIGDEQSKQPKRGCLKKLFGKKKRTTVEEKMAKENEQLQKQLHRYKDQNLKNKQELAKTKLELSDLKATHRVLVEQSRQHVANATEAAKIAQQQLSQLEKQVESEQCTHTRVLNETEQAHALALRRLQDQLNFYSSSGDRLSVIQKKANKELRRSFKAKNKLKVATDAEKAKLQEDMKRKELDHAAEIAKLSEKVQAQLFVKLGKARQRIHIA